MNGVETDIDCGGDECPRCDTGKDCDYNSDCSSGMCGKVGHPDDDVCWVRGSSCICIETAHPTPLPSPDPTRLPTSMPTYSPPVVVRVTLKGLSESSGTNGTLLEVNPSSKLTLDSNWISTDVETSFSWDVTCLDDPGATPELEYGVTTATGTNNEYLVIKPNILEGGSTYAFRLQVVNRYGAFGGGGINVTASRAPWGGFLSVEPKNGTTLETVFNLFASNWTDDPSSYPLSYAFKYGLEGGGTTFMRRPGAVQNVSTVLPLGYDDYQLPVAVLVADQLGSTTSKNDTVRVVPPSLDGAVNAVSQQTTAILSSIESGDSDSAMLLIKAGSELLNLVLQQGDSDEAVSSVEAEVRLNASYSSLIANDTARAKFEEQFIADLNLTLGCDSSQITINSLRHGSIIVTLQLTGGDSGEASDLYHALEGHIDAGDLHLAGYEVLGLQDTTGSSAAEEAAAVRSALIDATLSAASAAKTTEGVESGFVCMQSLSSTSPKSLSDEDKHKTVGLVSALANSSAHLGSVSTTAASAAVASLSNVVGVGVLTNASSSADTRRTLTGALSDLNLAITSDLVAGEEPVDISSTELGMTSLVIDQKQLSTGTFEVFVASAGAVSSLYPASFALPDDLLSVVGADDDGDGSTAVMAMSWASNPFESLAGGSLQANSSVTTLNVGTSAVSGLSEDKPIVLTLPLPGGATAVEGVLETFVLNCTNTTADIRYEFTSLEIERAAYCNTDIGYRDDLSTSTVVTSDLLSANFFCADSASAYDLQCDNTTGAIVFTCPFRVTGATCEFWDEDIGNWSDTGCTFWYSNYKEGFAKCNCTHLTDFSAQQEDKFGEQTSTFVSTADSVKDLTIEDVSKNVGILCLLGGIWAFCIMTYWRDKAQHKVANMKYLLGAYRSEHIRNVLKDLRYLMDRADAKRRGRKHDENQRATDHMDIIDRARAAKMASSLSFSRDESPETFAQVEQSLSQELVAKRRVMKNWFGGLKRDNELISFFFPATWDSTSSARRGIMLLAKVITLLFICCLAAPEMYLCPPQEHESVQVGDDAMVWSPVFGWGSH